MYQRRLLLGLASYSAGEGDTPLTEETYKVSCISTDLSLETRETNRPQRNRISPNDRWENQDASTHHLEIIRVVRLSRTTRSEPIL